MLTLSTIGGQTIYVSEDQIARVTDALQTDSGQRTYIHGPTDAAIVIDGDAQAFMSQFAGAGAFAKLTRPDGSRVWIRSETTSAVRAPTAQESQSHPAVKSVVIAAGASVQVKEDVAAVLAAIRW